MFSLKRHARDLGFFVFFAVGFFNCSSREGGCSSQGGCGSNACKLSQSELVEATMPSHDELREMSCACASAKAPDEDCTEELWDTRDLADSAGCSSELDALLLCIEDGDACDEEEGTSACDVDETALRDCIGSDAATDYTAVNRSRAPDREVEAASRGAR